MNIKYIGYTIPSGMRNITIKVGHGDTWFDMSLYQASQPSALGSGEVPDRYARDEVEVSPEVRAEVDKFVTEKLEEIRRRK